MNDLAITCPYCEREATYPSLEELFAQPGTVEDPNADCVRCPHCDLVFDVEVPGGETGGWRTRPYTSQELARANAGDVEIEYGEAVVSKRKLDAPEDPDGGVDEQAVIMGAMAESVAVDMERAMMEAAEEEWELELAQEAGVADPDPKGPPVPVDHVCCPMCRERGQFPEGYRLTDPPEITGWRTGDCAFPSWGDLEDEAPFNPNNWTCGALSKIRNMAADVEVWSEDQHVAVLAWPWKALHLVVSYYKHRGRTEGLHVLQDGQARVATYGDVRQFLHDHRCADARRVMRCRDEEVKEQWEAVRCPDCGAVPEVEAIAEGPEYRCTCGWSQIGPMPGVWEYERRHR